MTRPANLAQARRPDRAGRARGSAGLPAAAGGLGVSGRQRGGAAGRRRGDPRRRGLRAAAGAGGPARRGHPRRQLHRAGRGRLFNTTVVFDRDGAELARYRKLHLFDVVTPDGREYREVGVGRARRRRGHLRCRGVRVGCSICYDLRFGELYRRLAADGAQLLMVPAAFTLQTGKDHWEILLRARAIETQCFVAAAAQVGSFPGGPRHAPELGSQHDPRPVGQNAGPGARAARDSPRPGSTWNIWRACARCCR